MRNVVNNSWIVMMALLLGCGGAAFQKDTVGLEFPDELNVVLTPGMFSASVSLVQQVIVEQLPNKFSNDESAGSDHRFEFTAMVDVQDGEIVIAGLSPLGMRLFLLSVTERCFSYEAQMMFELPFPPEYLLRDFLLIFGNLGAIQEQLPEVKIESSDQSRVFSFSDEVMRVSYSAAGLSIGEVTATHLEEQYTLKVTTVQADLLTE